MQDEYAENRAGQRLRASIEGRGWTLTQFSKISGVPYRSVQDYVAGKSSPGFDQLARFANCGLDVSYILTGKSFSDEGRSLPDMMEIDHEHGVGRRPYRTIDVEPLIDKISDTFTLRDWINLWNLADDSVPPAELFKLDVKKRQGAVVYVASGIALNLIERMRAIGWLAR